MKDWKEIRSLKSNTQNKMVKKSEDLVFLLTSVEVRAKEKKTIALFYITTILIKKVTDTQPIGRSYNER